MHDVAPAELANLPGAHAWQSAALVEGATELAVPGAHWVHELLHPATA